MIYVGTDLLQVMSRWNHDPALIVALDYIRINNPSANVPYHNTRHMETVAALATVFYYESSEYPDLVSLRVLVLAALFHDFNHSAGEFTDDVNIERAIAGFRVFAEKYKLGHLVEGVEMLIRSTQYPIVKEPETLIEKILHDADYLYAVVQQRPEVILTDLRQEMEVRYARPISPIEMYLGQTKFMVNAKFYTEPGKNLWNDLSRSFHLKLKIECDRLKSERGE